MINRLYIGRKLNDFRELVDLYTQKYNDNIAFEFRNHPTDTDTIQIKYSQFSKDIKDLGTVLLKLGSKKVAIISSNRYEWCVAYLATTTAGLVVVPLDKSLPDNEIESLIERSEADTIFYSSKYENSVSKCKIKVCFDEIYSPIEDSTFFNTANNEAELSTKSNTKTSATIIENNQINKYDNNKLKIEDELSNLDTNKILYSSLISIGNKLDHTEYNNVKIDNRALSIMLFTSGTTSVSKAVMLSQTSICTTMHGLSQMIELFPDTRFLSFLPLHHTFESSCTFLFGTSCGLHIFFCDGLKYIQKNIVEFHIDGFVCVPLMLEIMYKKIVKEIEKQHKTFLINIMRIIFRHSRTDTKRKVFKPIIDSLGGHLKVIISGGAAMDKETLQGYNDFGFDIHQGYGLTETAAAIAGENSYYKKVGSVGFPLPTTTLKIDKPDKRGIGELLAKTDALMIGYYKNDEATKEVFQGGWFHTGDFAYIDKKGFVFITGRKKDMIVLKNGKKIFPEELEALINKLPYVSESMVFGHIDNTRTDRNDDVVLYAKIVLKEDENKEYEEVFNDIKNKINKQMPAYKYIRKIILTTEPLIKTTTQKVKRTEEMKKIKDELKKLEK